MDNRNGFLTSQGEFILPLEADIFFEDLFLLNLIGENTMITFASSPFLSPYVRMKKVVLRYTCDRCCGEGSHTMDGYDIYEDGHYDNYQVQCLECRGNGEFVLEFTSDDEIALWVDKAIKNRDHDWVSLFTLDSESWCTPEMERAKFYHGIIQELLWMLPKTRSQRIIDDNHDEGFLSSILPPCVPMENAVVNYICNHCAGYFHHLGSKFSLGDEIDDETYRKMNICFSFRTHYETIRRRIEQVRCLSCCKSGGLTMKFYRKNDEGLLKTRGKQQ